VATVIVASDGLPGVMLLAFGVLLFSPLVGMFMAQVMDARRIDDTHVWLRVGAPFLASHRR
jgi:hypothetical protein